MTNIFESAFMTLKNGMTMYFADSKARQWLRKLQEALAKKYGPDNPPPSTAGNIWYATCSTASGTGAKTATTSTGDFVLATGSMVRILFTTSNTAANPTISIDGSTAKAIRPISSASGMDYMWRAGEVIDIVYDGSNFVASDCGKASTSFYGVTKLDSSTSSTAEDVAATPKAVKTVADAKVDRAGDIMTGQLLMEMSGGDTYFSAKRTDTGVTASMGVGSGGQNHGVYTFGYNDGSYHSDGKWMIYRDYAGSVIVNGKATDNVLKSGDTMTGNLAVEKADEVNIWASNTKSGQVHKISMCAGGSGRGGIYDSTHGRWLVDYTLNGDLELGGVVYNKAEQLTITRTENLVANATQVGRLSAFKKNGMLFLNGNLQLLTGATTSNFVEIAAISGWSAASPVYQCIPPQSSVGSDPVVSFYLSTAGKLQIYAPNAITGNNWYRFSTCVPTSG